MADDIRRKFEYDKFKKEATCSSVLLESPFLISQSLQPHSLSVLVPGRTLLKLMLRSSLNIRTSFIKAIWLTFIAQAVTVTDRQTD